jgi:hypothetical protein
MANLSDIEIQEHHDGDGDEEEAYLVGNCFLRIETAGTKISIEVPDTTALREVAELAISMAKDLQTGVQ